MRLLPALALAVLPLLTAPRAHAKPAHTFTPAQAEGAQLRYIGEIPLAILSGSPEQIGRQHAALLAEPTRQALEYPKHLAAHLGLEAMWPLAASTGRAIMAHAPAPHRAELAALQTHARLDDGELAAANTLLELRRMGCATLIVEPQYSATGGPLFGRNFDFPTLGELQKYTLVMIYRPKGRRAFAAVGFPGLVGVVSGMNGAGLALAALDVEQSADGSRKLDLAGTPLACVFRRILEECTTVDEAERLLRSERVTTWMNLAVCDKHNGVVFEITPKHIARRDDEAGFVRCTNHFRTPGMTTGEQCWRYDQLTASRDPQAPLDVAVVQRSLHAANQGDLTLQTMVFEPRTLMLHLAIADPPTSDDPLATIDLGPLFAPK